MNTTAPSNRERILGGLWGSLVGDALGVPVEFKDRATVQADPVRDMRGFGTHHQPPGTWSDDSSLLLCSTDSLLRHEFDTGDMGQRFVRWMSNNLWTANGDVFDIGGTTSTALRCIAQGVPAEQAGGRLEDSNGNGSLMRILPVVLSVASQPIETLSDRVERASSITHAHARSRMACVFNGVVVQQLLRGVKPIFALDAARVTFAEWYEHAPELKRFHHLLDDDLTKLPEDEIVSTGYVLHTLHASLWCLLTTSTFEECVLKAVNLGGDTDTTGCVAGGLAGVHYGFNAIPKEWIEALARRADVETLFNDFCQLIESKS